MSISSQLKSWGLRQFELINDDILAKNEKFEMWQCFTSWVETSLAKKKSISYQKSIAALYKKNLKKVIQILDLRLKIFL
jgi:hypothetical protein